MNTHWTNRSSKDFLFRIAADFVSQLEDKMESVSMSQDELAQRLGVTKGRVSQILNNPGNISLGKVVEYARTLEMKVSIVAYEDDDPKNERGPINSAVFNICWEKCGKPQDFWDLEEESTASTMETSIPFENIQSDAADEGYVRKSNEKSELSGEIVHPPVTISDSSNGDWREYG